jgi:hypothetical protein
MPDRRSSDRRSSDLDARFDAELSRAARSLVTEELPRGILDTGLAPSGVRPGAVRARRSVPAFGGLAAAVILVLVTAIALVPGGLLRPGPSAAPTASPTAPASLAPSAIPSAGPALHGSFRSTSEIQADLESLGYACSPGGVILPTGPSPSAMVREGAVCSAPTGAGPYMAVVIVGVAADGRAVELHVKADLTGDDTPAARDAIAVPLAKAVAIAVQGQGTGNQLAAWVMDAVAALAPQQANSTDQLGFVVKITRSQSGSYQVFAHPS